MIIIRSKNNIPVRLTKERWEHIIGGHPEMHDQKERVMETLREPDYIQQGDFEELIAVKFYEDTPFGAKYMVVIYKETSIDDGFILTAYLTRMPSQSRRTVWKP